MDDREHVLGSGNVQLICDGTRRQKAREQAQQRLFREDPPPDDAPAADPSDDQPPADLDTAEADPDPTEAD